MSKQIEYLKEYEWADERDLLYPIVNGMRSFNPPLGMKWVVRTLDDKAIFFKKESDMIAYEVDDCVNYEHIKKRRDFLQAKVKELNVKANRIQT